MRHFFLRHTLRLIKNVLFLTNAALAYIKSYLCTDSAEGIYGASAQRFRDSWTFQKDALNIFKHHPTQFLAK